MFKGTYTALVTPFKNNAIDFEALRTLVEFQITEGITGIVACGSTGEAFFLSPDEQYQVLKAVTETSKGRIPIIAGTSALTLKDTLVLTAQAESLGVQGLMIVTPPYTKPTQQALYEYFKAIHDATSTPLLLYDNPSRSGRSLEDATVIRLSALPRIQCMKDSSGDLTRPATLLESLPPSFTLLSGEDATAPAYFAQGGHGVVSVSSNVAPRLVSEQWRAWEAQDLKGLAMARTLLNPLHRAMFVESNPAPAKYALSRFGYCTPDVRNPLLPVTANGASVIDQAMKHAGLSLTPQVKASHG